MKTTFSNTQVREGPVERHSLGPAADPTIRAPSHRLTYARDASLYRNGDSAESLFRLTDGMVRIGRLTPEGCVVTVRHVLPGNFFGEESLIGASHGASAQALTDVVVDSFDPAFIDPSDVLVVMDSLSRQLQSLMDFGYHLQSGDLYQRVSRYLIWLAGTPLAERDARGRVSIGVTHEMIAEGTGSTRESVSKIITELRSEGRIESGYRSIILTETASLGMIVEGLT